MPRTVTNTYTQMARVQSCANHVQHIKRLSRATCSAPLGTKGQLSCYAWQSWYQWRFFIFPCLVEINESIRTLSELVLQYPLSWTSTQYSFQIWCYSCFEIFFLFCVHCLVGLVVKASASRAEDPGFKPRLRWDFSRVESYQWLRNWRSRGYPGRHLVL